LSVKERPVGVTILAILEIIVGLVSFFGGLGAVILGGVLGGLIGGTGGVAALIGGVVIGGILVIIGLVSFVIAYGFWKGSGWAWILGLIFAVIGLIMGLISLPSGIITILMEALILYYLTRPHVKEFFGKASTPL
jgi:hypothetical protein